MKNCTTAGRSMIKSDGKPTIRPGEMFALRIVKIEGLEVFICRSIRQANFSREWTLDNGAARSFSM